MSKYLKAMDRKSALRRIKSSIKNSLIQRSKIDIEIINSFTKEEKKELIEKRKILSKKLLRMQSSKQYLENWKNHREYQKHYRKEKKNANKSR